MSKKIVTHHNPDLDAVASCWLIKRFLPGWQEAEIAFCEPNSTIDGKLVDSDPDILHVDVAEGKLDHHQLEKRTAAAFLVYEFVKKTLAEEGKRLKALKEKALTEIVKVVVEVDNAGDLFWPEAAQSRNNFYLHYLISGIRGIGKDDRAVIEFGFLAMDSLLYTTKKGIDAREELKKGIEFKTCWSKAIALETGNDNVLWEGEKLGYSIVVRRDPKLGNVRIYSRPDRKVDLTKAYQEIKAKDREADWYLHSSKTLLLNGSEMKKMKPTGLTLKEIVNILKKQES